VGVRRAALTGLLLALSLAGCGSSEQPSRPSSTAASSGAAVRPPQRTATTPAPVAHPQAIEPVAGKAAAAPKPSDPAQVSVGPATGSSGGGSVLARPVSDAVVRQELAASGLPADTSQAALTPSGLAVAPVDAPEQVQQVVSAGNEIAHLPYRFGGGHGTFEDSAYDCSGSLSFVFAASGLLTTTLTSGELEHWGRPGRGRWITVFAAPGHTFMYVAGLRFDTVALAETGSRWSGRAADEPDLNRFVARHPAGL
jgi:cell wall-associated NlpC family hydrolase